MGLEQMPGAGGTPPLEEAKKNGEQEKEMIFQRKIEEMKKTMVEKEEGQSKETEEWAVKNKEKLVSEIKEKGLKEANLRPETICLLYKNHDLSAKDIFESFFKSGSGDYISHTFIPRFPRDFLVSISKEEPRFQDTFQYEYKSIFEKIPSSPGKLDEMMLLYYAALIKKIPLDQEHKIGTPNGPSMVKNLMDAYISSSSVKNNDQMVKNRFLLHSDVVGDVVESKIFSQEEISKIFSEFSSYLKKNRKVDTIAQLIGTVIDIKRGGLINKEEADKILENI